MEDRVTVADGRVLTYCWWGNPAGKPVFVLHGTPGSRYSRHPDESVFTDAGVHAITYDRPGYGESTRDPGRRVADAVADVVAIADHLGIGRFAVTGASGGGPHSLACGALLPERVTRCATVGGPAPLGPDGMSETQFVAGMAEWNAQLFQLAVAGEDHLRPVLERSVAELLAGIGAAAERSPANPVGLSEPDRQVLSRPDIAAMLAASIAEGVGRTVDGLVDDDLALTRPWGFDVSTIAVPVAIWYSQYDTLIPAAHGEWLLQAIPGAEASLLDGGHFAVYDSLEKLLRWLAAGS